MNDKKASKFAERQGSIVIDIPAFLFYCKENKILARNQIREVISDLKKKDFYLFGEDVKKELIS